MRHERWRARFGAMVAVGLLGAAGAVAVFAISRTPIARLLPTGVARAMQMAPAAPVRVGGNIGAPRKIRHVNPVYPQDAQDARIQGMVIVEARIDPEGNVADARVLRSIPMLDQAALDAVRQWTYTPTLLNGQAVPVIMTVTVNFTLSAGGGTGAAAGRPGGAPTGLTPADEAARTPFLIERQRAGVVQSGMTVDDLYTVLPREQARLVDLWLEGMFSPALEIRTDAGAAKPALIAELAPAPDWRLARLTVLDPRFRTADGLGVGSTFGELQARYPNVLVTTGEGRRYATPGGTGLSFRLAPERENPGATSAAPNTRVDAVLVVGGSYSLRPPR